MESHPATLKIIIKILFSPLTFSTTTSPSLLDTTLIKGFSGFSKSKQTKLSLVWSKNLSLQVVE